MLVIEVSTKPLLNLSLIGYFRVCWLSKITYKAKTDQGGRNENSKRGTVKLYQSKLRFWFFGFFLWQCQGLALRLVLLWQLLIRHRSGDCPHPAKLQRTEQTKGQGQGVTEGPNCNADRFNYLPSAVCQKWSISTANCSQGLAEL